MDMTEQCPQRYDRMGDMWPSETGDYVQYQHYAALKDENAKLRRQLTLAQENNHRRNLELDALHYVWCDGGCEGGMHRWTDAPPLTREQVEAAVACVERLQRYYVNLQFRKLPLDQRKEFFDLKARVAELERLLRSSEFWGRQTMGRPEVTP